MNCFSGVTYRLGPRRMRMKSRPLISAVTTPKGGFVERSPVLSCKRSAGFVLTG